MSGAAPAVDGLSRVVAVADTVLFEGYMLYPYRANDAKNRVRWQFGVLAPPALAAVDPSERCFLQTDCLLDGGREVTLTVQVRFLQVQRRSVQALAGGAYRTVGSLDVGDATFLPWDEAVVHEPTMTMGLPGSGPQDFPIAAEAATDVEPLVQDGRPVGRLVRQRAALTGRVSVTAERLPGPYGVQRLRVRVENTTAWQPAAEPQRAEALQHALVAAHVLLRVESGGFISLTDPPQWARPYVDACEQVGAFPVLGGPPGDRSVVLAAPIILYDHPEVAPESTSQFCDATEMDEMLTLRTLTLTDEEKRQARGSDARAAALVDQVDNLPPELMQRLHGAIRSMSRVARPADTAVDQPPPDSAPPWWNPEVDAAVDPDTDVVMIDGSPVGRGSAVLLRPGRHRADAQDMFLDGRRATVEAVLLDVDGGAHLAVSLDDLADEGYRPHGRFLYFALDEVLPLAGDPS